MKKPDKTVLVFLYRAAVGRRMALCFLIFLQITLSLANIGFVLAMREALDGAAAGAPARFGNSMLVMLLLIVLRIAARACLRYWEEHVRASLENKLKENLFRRLLSAPLAQTEAIHTGEWMNRMTSDTTVIANGMTEIFPNLIGMLVKLGGAVLMLIVMIPGIAVFLLPIAVTVLLLTGGLRKLMKNSHKAVQARDGVLRAYLQERLSCMMILRAFRAEEITARDAAERMRKHKAARMKKAVISDIANTGFSAMMNLLYLAGFLWCGRGILAGTVTYGTLLAVIQLIGQLQTPFAGLSGMVPQFYAMTASAERLMEVEAPESPETAVVDAPAFSALRVAEVSFAYPGEARARILSDVSLSIDRGAFVALTGHSGCGKSTLFKLFLCLYAPTAGTIFLRGTAGAESEIPLTAAHRALFAYVPQGNQLMSGTVRETVTFAHKDNPDPEKLWDALRVACADTFVAALENGVETELGEHGAGLSEGQLQRLAIARAIYDGAPILLLDEATSALDAETEQQVLENIRAMTDRTVIIVTHRPAALSFCSHIVQMREDGVTVVCGSLQTDDSRWSL